jgi:hypothetical protein
MRTHRRFAIVPVLDCLSSRIAPSTLAVAVTSPTDSTADVTNLDPTQDTSTTDPSQIDPSQNDDPDNDAPSPVDFDWTPFCAVEDYSAVNLPC